MKSIFQAGRNCFQVAHADRASVLVDGESYYKAFARAAEQAQRSIMILAWDFDSRTRLLWNDSTFGPPPVLGALLNFLVRRRRKLRVYVLNWDYPMIFGTDREFPPLYGLNWRPWRRVHLRYDNTYPVGGSHHQKIVVIDDAVAFSGGLDFTCRRWDTCEHPANDPRRCANGKPYPPFHDVMAIVDGAAARVLGDIARERWRRATGKTIPPAAAKGDPWPRDLQPELTDVTVGISRTMPERISQPAVKEIEALYLDMIAAARRYIYIENQYFTAQRIGEALAARLSSRDGPEVVMVLRLLSHGWLEEHTMHVLRTRLIEMLRKADRWNRLGVYYPHIEGLTEGTCLDVHSKVMIVDDEWLRVGSANLCNRSLGMDSECDLTFEARGESRVAAATRECRDRLLAEHLGASQQQVHAEYERGSSMKSVIAALQRNQRTLKPLDHLPEWPGVVVDIAAVADPEQPVPLEKLVAEFAPTMNAEKSGPAWGAFLWVALVIAGLTAVWQLTPLAEVATADRVIALARDIGGRWWAPLMVLAVYTPACIVMFPRPLITLFTVLAFGAWLGFVYAMSGILVAALATYLTGRLLDRATVRRLAGRRLNQVSEMLRKHGLLAITALRLVPLAPFAVEGLVAGAIRIKLRQYTLGTAIGLLPGTLTTTVFGNQLETALRDPAEINYWLLTGIAVFFVIAVLMVRRWVFNGRLLRPSSGRRQ